MYVNIDANTVCTPFFNSFAGREKVTKEEVCSFLDRYQEGKVTDILFNIFSQHSVVDSSVFSTYADKYLQKEENGVAVDYTEEYKGIYELNTKHQIDPYGTWFQRCREIGINPWLSVRMNDCHHNDDDACFLRSDFFYEAKEKGWMVGEKYGYFHCNFNYAVPQVRQKMLAYIKEQLGQYDVYGIELDFLREIVCFDYLSAKEGECARIMNEFMREVKAEVCRAEEKYGHKIKIAARLSRDMEQSYVFGFDAVTWEKEKLVDVIIPSPRWLSSDSQMPVEVWKEKLSDTEIIPCIETAVFFDGEEGFNMTAETARGHAAMFYSRGAEDIYLYNYYGYEPERDTEVYRTCQSREEIFKNQVRYLLLWQEPDTCPIGMQRYLPVPFTLQKGEERKVEFETGAIPSEKGVSLAVGFKDGTPEDITLLLNGVECEGFEEVLEKKTGMKKRYHYYRCPVKTEESIQKLTFRGKAENVTVVWIEMQTD